MNNKNKKPRGMMVEIYESKGLGNCSNGGISSRNKRALLIGDGIAEIFEAGPDDAVIMMEHRKINGREYLTAYPVNGKDPAACGWMFGGAFIFSNDSRFPSDYPIPLHDRQESQALNEVLSR